MLMFMPVNSVHNYVPAPYKLHVKLSPLRFGYYTQSLNISHCMESSKYNTLRQKYQIPLSFFRRQDFEFILLSGCLHVVS